jgi:lipopolysaccharide export system protein LptA
MKIRSFPQITALAAALVLAGSASAQRDNKSLITSPQYATPQSTEIKSDAVEMWSTDTETRGIFSGNVVVTGTNLRITCDRLEVTATQIGDKNSTVGTLEKFKYLLATGKVQIVQGDREATCGRAEVFPRDEKIVLTEEPMVVDHGNDGRFIGSKLELFRGQRRVTGEHVRFIGPEIKDLGFDKNEAPHTAPAPAPAPDAATPPANSEAKSVPTPPAK